jgi:hypothetical protein
MEEEAKSLMEGNGEKKQQTLAAATLHIDDQCHSFYESAQLQRDQTQAKLIESGLHSLSRVQEEISEYFKSYVHNVSLLKFLARLQSANMITVYHIMIII